MILGQVFVLLLIAVGHGSSLPLNDDDNQNCAKHKDCMSCVLKSCVFYSNLDGGFCGGRTMDSRLFIYKARNPSGCFRLSGSDNWGNSKYVALAEDSTTTEMGISSSRTANGGDGKIQTSFQHTSVHLPFIAPQQETRYPTNSSISHTTAKTTAVEMNEIKDDRSEKTKNALERLKTLSCRQYAFIAAQMSEKQKGEEKLYKKCMRKLFMS